MILLRLSGSCYLLLHNARAISLKLVHLKAPQRSVSMVFGFSPQQLEGTTKKFRVTFFSKYRFWYNSISIHTAVIISSYLHIRNYICCRSSVLDQTLATSPKQFHKPGSVLFQFVNHVHWLCIRKALSSTSKQNSNKYLQQHSCQRLTTMFSQSVRYMTFQVSRGHVTCSMLSHDVMPKGVFPRMN